MKKAISKILLFFLFSPNIVFAGFAYVDDWSITKIENQNKITASSNENLVALSAYCKYPENLSINSYAQREFSLNGFSDPVKITLLTVIDMNSEFLQWGISTGINHSFMVDTFQGSFERDQILPGEIIYRYSYIQNLFLPNGVYKITSQFSPIVRPDLIKTYFEKIMVNATVQFGIIAINDHPIVPELSGVCTIAIGIILIMMRRKNETSS